MESEAPPASGQVAVVVDGGLLEGWQMKCQVCGVESGESVSKAGLSIQTNEPAYGIIGGNLPRRPETGWNWEDNFVAVFGFWDQRAKVVFQICGACLVARLTGPIVKDCSDAIVYGSDEPIYSE